ncbi:hypothetical protein NC651_026236 [Populus alba x Populus x berolinensis]|nr:hypothetical protein NC651_026236 [Populus alba x Populus x berolinensis]
MVSSAELAILTKKKGRQAGRHACGRRRRRRRRRPVKTPRSLLILHSIPIFLPFLVKEQGGDHWPEGISPAVSSRKAMHQSVLRRDEILSQ